MRFHTLISCIISFLIASDAIDSISPNQSLAYPQTIVSSGGNYELGFFSPGNNISGNLNLYLGIWYKKVSSGTVVWVANRDTALTDRSGVLRLTDRGSLALVNSTDNSIIWSSNSTGFVQNPVAQILDSGNLVVRDAGDDDLENYFWQSFDHPSDTALPGMKIGVNLVTGLNRYLTSWKSNSDPSLGDYTFVLDQHGYPQTFLMKGSERRFRSGPWNGLRFSGSPGLKPNQIYTYEFVFNQEEIFYRFNLVDSSVFTRLWLNPTGTLQRLTWNHGRQDWTVFINAPADNCDTYSQCSSYGICNIGNSPICGCLDKFAPRNPRGWALADWTGGCVRRTPLDCKKGDGFIKYSGIKLPDTRNSRYNKSMNLKDCAQVCLRNCSCMAYANSDIRGRGSGCLLWFDDLLDITELNENGQDIYIRMAASEIGSGSGKLKKIRIGFGTLAGILLLALCLILYITRKKMMMNKKQEQNQLITQGTIGSSSNQLYFKETEREELELPLFDFATIANATDNFSAKNRLGEGGYGPVYKGMLKEGQEIAVKRLSKYSIQGLGEFMNEVTFIAKLQHRNLVKLLGCCIEAEEKMLIYEYMPNGSLDFFIFDEEQKKLLDWPKRFHIINGIARGILYLHEDSRLRIIHRDLKASNVLLDSEMNPKISDFGMARCFGGNNSTPVNTNRVVGTYGYMSPEYAVDGFFSVKSDVFSFGVLVLEIISGEKNRGFYHPDHHHNLLGHAWILFREGRFPEFIDENLADSCYLSEVLRSMHVGLLCVQQFTEDRPSMSSVLLMLGSEGALPMPKEPGFFTERSMLFEIDSSWSKHAESSGNNFSITSLGAR